MNDSAPEAVAPLDAYITAKPGEPTWSLQGGDPLAAPLLRLWAHLARVRTGLFQGDADWIYPSLEAACHSDNDVSGDAGEVSDLLLRATETEKVSWQMDAYRRDGTVAEGPKSAGENSLSETERLDLHDTRVRAAQAISNIRGDIRGLRIGLIDKWSVMDKKQAKDLDAALKEAQDLLGFIRETIEPRRLFKKA